MILDITFHPIKVASKERDCGPDHGYGGATFFDLFAIIHHRTSILIITMNVTDYFNKGGEQTLQPRFRTFDEKTSSINECH